MTIRGGTVTDPGSIPEHVVEAAYCSYPVELRVAIAAALDALMDDEPLEVRDAFDEMHFVKVRPSDVLAAVLARGEAR